MLKDLTRVGDIDKVLFEKRYDELFPSLKETYKMVVIEDIHHGKIIGAGSLIIERKFILDLGICGHIEDVAVETSYRGRNLGRRLIELLKAMAQY